MANKIKGFSLVELLTVITIIGILASLTSLAVGSFIRNANLNTYRDNILSFVEQARSRSITSVPHGIVFVNSGSFQFVRLTDTNGNFIVDTGESYTVLETVSLRDGYSLTWNRETGADLCAAANDAVLWFDRKGMPRCSNWGLGLSTITVTSASVNKQVVVDRAGKIKYE